MKTLNLTTTTMTIEPHPLGFVQVRDASGAYQRHDGSAWRAFFHTATDARRYIEFCEREGRMTHFDHDGRRAWARIWDAVAGEGLVRNEIGERDGR